MEGHICKGERMAMHQTDRTKAANAHVSKGQATERPDGAAKIMVKVLESASWLSKAC
jgi:hypothetical protein